MNEPKNETQPSRVDEKQLTNERWSRRLPQVAAALKRANVVYIRLTYRGEWDVGILDDPVFYTGSLKLMNPALTGATRRELRMFFRELLELRYPGWQNAEGSRGEFEWEVVRDTLTHVHGWRHFEYDFEVVSGL